MKGIAQDRSSPTLTQKNSLSVEAGLRPIKIGVSGKRYISPDDKDIVSNVIKEIINAILQKHGAKEFIGYTAIAAGADTIFADVVTKEFHQPIQVILPFSMEEYKKDFEGKDLEEYKRLLNDNQVNKVIATTPPTDNDSRNDAYYNTGKYIVDETDEMIFIWDQLKPGGKGGTAEIIGYFSEKYPEKKIYRINVKAKETDPINDLIIGRYEEADQIAMKRRDNHRRVWKSAIILGWFAVLFFAINTAFHPAKYELLLLGLEFVLVSTVFILIFLAHRKNYHRDYLTYRLKAETLRLLRSFYHAGTRVSISEQTKQTDKELAAIAKRSNDEAKIIDKRSKWYSQYVIRSLINDQCSYHENKIKAIGNKHHNFERIMIVIALTFFLNLLLYMTYTFLEHWHIKPPFTYPHDINIFVTILLPATYATLEGFIHFNEWMLLKKYSEFARQGLRECKELLPINLEQHTLEECHKKQSEVLNLVSGIMLNDNRNWSLLLENKDSYNMIV
jgi:uncharacterized phage-like protein YoqJ